MRRSSIIILNYNGRELLANGIPSVLEAVERSGTVHEVMVVDNGSTDGSVDFLRGNFPSVRVLALDKNYGFAGGNNQGILVARYDVVVLLNNDMVVDKDFLNPLLEGFADETVFAVSAQIYFQDKGKKREETGKTRFFWDKGMIYCFHEAVDESDYRRKYLPIVWAGGGSAAYDKAKFVKLGMFDELYSPCYVEDLDISYMAWKRGWKSLFCPESIVYHKHRATALRRYTNEELEVIIARHRLLFLWKNLTSPKYLLSHLCLLPLHIVKEIRRERRNILLKASIGALSRIPRLVRSRLRARPKAVVSDDIIFRGEYVRGSARSPDRKLRILFVSPYVPCLDVHATAARMYHIARALAGRHEVSILTFIEEPSEKKHVEALETFCNSVEFIQRHQSLDTPDYFHIIPNMVVKEFCQPEMKDLLFRHLLSGRYDVVQFEYLQMAYLGTKVRQIGIPMVWVDHEVQHAALWKEFRHERWWKWNKIELFFRWMVMLSFELSIARHFDHTITVTEHDERELKAYLPALRSSVVPLGVDLGYFSPGSMKVITPREEVIIFTGYFLHYPNVDAVKYFLKEILPLVKESIPSVQFWIVGSSPPVELTSISGDDGVRVTGWVPDLRPYLDEAALYVAPLRLGVGIRGKILEALAMKKAVVATRLAAQGIPATPGEGIVVADSAKEFAREVVRLLKNPQLREEIGERGRELVQRNFAWDRIVHLNESALYSSLGIAEDQD